MPLHLSRGTSVRSKCGKGVGGGFNVLNIVQVLHSWRILPTLLRIGCSKALSCTPAQSSEPCLEPCNSWIAFLCQETSKSHWHLSNPPSNGIQWSQESFVTELLSPPCIGYPQVTTLPLRSMAANAAEDATILSIPRSLPRGTMGNHGDDADG